MADTTITLGGTTVRPIGLGTNRLTNTAANVAFVRDAIDAGLQHVDTAYLYTSGESEQTIGAALDLPREGCAVATKGGYQAGEGRPEVLRTHIDESLRRLRTDVIDLYYLHRVHPDTPLEESLATIREYHQAGRIKHVGISEVSIEQVERARSVVPIAAVQNRYNLADRAHDDVLDHCEREGIVFVPYFPLRGQDSAAVAEVAERRGLTTSQVVLAWLLHRSPAMLPIPGTLSLGHLRENLAALEIELTNDEFEALSQS
jgi:aryl-alcohol dehydrogenase-like predicted oxidoreductase